MRCGIKPFQVLAIHSALLAVGISTACAPEAYPPTAAPAPPPALAPSPPSAPSAPPAAPAARAAASSESSIETRIGKLTLESGYPSPETLSKAYDELDFQRAGQAYVWATPIVALDALRVANKSDWNVDFNAVCMVDHFTDPSVEALTANNTTISSRPTQTARSMSISVSPRRRANRAIGSRPCPAKAGSPISAGTDRPKRSSTRAGSSKIWFASIEARRPVIQPFI